jgi:hypothetical protein
MVTVVEIRGIRFYVTRAGINTGKKVRNGKVYIYYTKRVILPRDFPGDKVYVLSEEEFKKLEKILNFCILPELV